MLHICIVIYDDKLTDAFMHCVIYLNHSTLDRPAVVYVALEKRYVLSGMNIACE